MSELFVPLSRHFSAIDGLQKAHTLVYALDRDTDGIWMTVGRTGEHATADSVLVSADPQQCEALLRYLCENAVGPEHWRDILAECFPLSNGCEKKGGMLFEK